MNYDQGGFIPSGLIPLRLSRGCVYMTPTQYENLGPKTISQLWPDSDVEIVYSAHDVREGGDKALRVIQQELDRRAKPE